MVHRVQYSLIHTYSYNITVSIWLYYQLKNILNRDPKSYIQIIAY